MLFDIKQFSALFLEKLYVQEHISFDMVDKDVEDAARTGGNGRHEIGARKDFSVADDAKFHQIIRSTVLIVEKCWKRIVNFVQIVVMI